MTPDLLHDDERLFEQLTSSWCLQLGFTDVKKNGGAPGVDGITIKTFQSNLDKELCQLSKDIRNWTYKLDSEVFNC